VVKLGHEELRLPGDLVRSWCDRREAVSPERQPRTELVSREPHRILAVH
jgi:hypothetical protein